MKNTNAKKELNINYDFLAKEDITKLYQHYHTSIEGLSEEQALTIREEKGSNAITYGKKTPFFVEVLKAYVTPFTLVLIALCIISFFTEYVFAPSDDKDLVSVVVILILVIVSGTMTLVQSVRSNKAADELKSMVRVTASVKRNNTFSEIPMEDIVIGDIVHLSAGDMIPADIRLISTKDLFLSQGTLTGESYPVEKRAEVVIDKVDSPTSYENLVFMGSNVLSGSATGVVIGTGDTTLFGGVAKTLTQAPAKTNFEKGIEKTSYLLIKFMLIMAPIVVIINVLTKGDWLQSILFGLSVAVGLTPEMLPMIVTSNLVRGASIMAKKGTIIKNLNAIQNFGAIDILCTDKTGTLTQDKIILEYHIAIDGQEDSRVLRHAYLNSYFQTGLKNLMDVAIINAAHEELDISSFEDYQKVDEIPFDFERRRMSVVVADECGKTQMVTKGAIEEMLDISSFVDLKGEIIPITDEVKQKVLDKVRDLNSDGLRVLGIAQKTNPSVVGEFSIADERDMVLIGYLAFLDPPKETTKAAIEALHQHGVGIKVLTGDNALVTRAVCQQVGLEAQEIITGEMISGLSDKALSELAETHSIFVKLTPQQKAHIIEVLRQAGHIVGYLGDGINDAPAMRLADVGISVDTAVDIAKESADVILLNKDLMILEQGIVSGRQTFGNIMKYIKSTASSNFGNMFSVLAASIFLPFLPMLPLQILFLNLIYDMTCISIPTDHMDIEYIKEPKKWKADNLSSFMFWFGPTSSIFDMTTFALLYFVICPSVVGGAYHSLGLSQQLIFMGVFHSGWFVESIWTQTMVLHALRTPKIPFIQSRASLAMTLVTFIGMAVGTVLPFLPFGEELGLSPLPLDFWPWLILTIVVYLTLITLLKKYYIQRYGELL